LILGEAVTTGLIAGVLGLALSYPIVQIAMGHWLEQNMGGFFPYFRINVIVAAVAIVLAIVLSVVAALVPALSASRMSVLDALRRIG
jgi:putative ABC transport system permease protein